MANKNKKNTQYKTLLSVLAYGSTDKSRELLKKHTGSDAMNTKDLEEKLARVYALSSDKIGIEKEFAEIHPHKDFILKYTKPKVELGALKPVEETAVKADIPTEVKNVIVHDGYSNCEGSATCNCNKMSNACGCGGSSSADGDNGYSSAFGGTVNTINNQAIVVVGLVSVVAIVGMVLFLHKNKN